LTANKVHENFIKAVAEGRNIPEEKVRQFADGRVILGTEAKQLGLVDDFGDVYDAGRSALELAKVELKPDELPNLVFINRKKGFFSKLADASSALPEIVGAGSAVPTLKYLAY
jgi:protease-4